MSDKELENLTASADDYISISSVEDALINLWSKMAEAQPDEAMMRATTINLVLDTSSAESAPSIIGEVTQVNPCRAIVIETGNGDSAALRAMPTLFCRPSLGRQARMQVCCEEILIRVNNKSEVHLPGAVQSLLLSDLPVYVFREGEVSPMDTLVKGLDEAIDGLIVDSSTFTSIPAGLRNLSALVEASHLDLNLFDLNWQRLLPWRKALARFFDSPDDRASLLRVEHVEVIHYGAAAEGLLFLGWLVSRLGWRLVLERSEQGRWTARTSTGTVELSLRGEDHPEHANQTAGLLEVSVTTDARKYRVTLSPDGTYCICPDAQMPAMLVPASSTGALISAIIDQNRHDPIFEEALSVAALLSSEGSTLSQRAGIVVAEDASSLARLAAHYFVQAARQAIRRDDRFTVALSGGSTPKALYHLLAEAPYRDQVDWANVHIFWGDERNVPIDHNDSDQRMAHEALLDHIPIPPENIHGILTGQLSAEDAAARYADEMRAFFGVEQGELPEFDLILLGLGEDGHTASLFPRTKALDAEASLLVVANEVPQLKTKRVTFTVGLINYASNVVFLVSGKTKADIMAAVFKGPMRPDDLPAQLIHPAEGALLVMADQDAAAKLK